MKVDLIIGPLMPETVELLHGLHLFAALRAVGDIEDLGEPEGAGRADDGADVGLLADVVQEQVSFGLLFVHC